jgi:hypothetical protein
MHRPIRCSHVQVYIRRIGRSDIVRRAAGSTKFLKKHAIRGATFGVLPSTINDVAFHHAQLNFSEVLHVTIDTVTVTSINTVASILMTVVKF